MSSEVLKLRDKIERGRPLYAEDVRHVTDVLQVHEQLVSFLKSAIQNLDLGVEGTQELREKVVAFLAELG